MNLKLCRNKSNTTRKGRYIDKNIAKKLTEIELGINAFRERKYAKVIQYLGNKALNPKTTDRIKLIVGASYTEIDMHEKETLELLDSIIQKYKNEPLSFKAEFIKLVEQLECDEEEKNKILTIGLEALQGEDLSI